MFAAVATAYTTSWTYNSADLPVTMTYPDGEVVTNTYDPARMLLDTVTGTGTFGTANYVTDTIYDSAGRVTDRALGNGLTQKFLYYPWNSQGGALNVIGAGTGTWDTGTLRFSNSVLDLEYSYDNVGNITQIVNTDTATETQNYGYDSLNRLTSATVTGGPAPYSESYSYDPDTGNLASKGGVNYTYQPAHPHAVTSAGGTYTYDANGNMETRPVNGQTYTLSYDAEGHLVTVSGGSYSAAFTYDGDGKRVKSSIGSVDTLFVGNCYEKTGSTITKYYYAGATRIGMRKYTIPQSMVVEYFLGDHLGSTSTTTDAAGAKVSELRYKPFGEVRYTWKDATLTQTTPAYALTKWTFTGQYSYADDPSTPGLEDFGLLYFNARWVDPTLGRFAQTDTIIPGAGDPQAWDRYAYGLNNPSRYLDPTGHSVECALGEQYCKAGDLDAKRRALDYANHMRYRARHGTVWTWEGLETVGGASVLSEAGWTKGDYYDHILGGVSPADPLHDPATYLIASGALLWKPAIILLGSQFATQNADGRMVSIGSFDLRGLQGYIEAGRANGWTYFDLGKAFGLLDRLGLAQPMNDAFMANQIQQGKDFAVTVSGKLGPGTAAEIQLIKQSMLYLQSAFTSYPQFWSHLPWTSLP